MQWLSQWRVWPGVALALAGVPIADTHLNQAIAAIAVLFAVAAAWHSEGTRLLALKEL